MILRMRSIFTLNGIIEEVSFISYLELIIYATWSSKQEILLLSKKSKNMKTLAAIVRQREEGKKLLQIEEVVPRSLHILQEKFWLL